MPLAFDIAMCVYTIIGFGALWTMVKSNTPGSKHYEPL